MKKVYLIAAVLILNASLALDVSIPVNMTARVEIPLPRGEGVVMLDGKSVEAEAVGGYAVIEDVGSGMH